MSPHIAAQPRFNALNDLADMMERLAASNNGAIMTKAFRFHAIGGPEVLRFEDVELPAPGPGEVRMRNVAVALNFRDVLMRKGVHAVKSLPSGIGLESAGVIAALGPGVEGFKVGDRVAYAGMPEGACAEERIVPAARLIPLPAPSASAPPPR